jgi:thioredoxin reductase (NADPH)
VRTGETVREVERIAPLHFRVTTDRGQHEAARVILAIGRRGVPRKLGIPGEASPHVFYTLREPEVFTNDRIVVVGGGDSAVEAALALSEQPGNEVRISYRRPAFNRIKPGNLNRIEDAIQRSTVDVLWSTEPTEIRPGRVRLAGPEGPGEIPADQLFVFIGGELPTGFLRQCGVEIETKFGEP